MIEREIKVRIRIHTGTNKMAYEQTVLPPSQKWWGTALTILPPYLPPT